MIHLHTLGDALIRVGEKEIRPTSPLMFAALLYLSMERGRRVPRAALQELLFPTSDERSGAHSLRQLLYKLRHLGAPLDVDVATVRIDSEKIGTDFVPQIFPASHSPHALPTGLSFLPGYSPGFSEAFSRWLEATRDAVNSDLRRSLIQSIRSRRDALDWRRVEHFARLLLDLDPLNEEAVLGLAEATALTGSKDKAVRILARYEQESGQRGPRLPASLLRARMSELGRSPPLSTPPFCGRDTQSEQLRQHIRLAGRGQASVALVYGDAGIGKTRLVEEARAAAAIEGYLTRTVRCQAHYSGRPSSVLIDLIPQLLSARGALGVSPDSLATLRLLTEVAECGSRGPGDSTDARTRSTTILAAFRDLVDAVAAETPLLLVIEDVHWADRDSLSELNHIAQRRPATAVAMVLTARSPIHIEELFAGDCALPLRLGPLSLEAMRQLVAHCFRGHRATDNVVDWCIHTAAGNPLFLQMLCSHYRSSAVPFEVPPDLVSIITRRIERLPADQRRVLEFVALLGTHSSMTLLRSLTGLRSVQLRESVRMLEEEGHLVLQNGRPRTTHALLAESVLHLVPPLSLGLLHGCVAAALEDQHLASHDASLLWDCAEHWSLSGESGKALQFVRQCAQHATRIGKVSFAFELLEKSRHLVTEPSEVALLLEELMLTAKAADRWQEVLTLSHELAATRNSAAGPHSAAELAVLEAQWVIQMEAHQVLDRLTVCVSDRTADREHRMDAALLLLRIAHELCDEALARQAYQPLASLLGSRTGTYTERIIPLIYETSFGHVALAAQLATELVADIDLLPSLSDQFRAISNAALTMVVCGDLAAARNLLMAYVEKTTLLQMPDWASEFASVVCWTYLTDESFGEAARWHDRAADLRRGSTSSLHTYRFAANAFELALAAGEAAVANDMLNVLLANAGDSIRARAYQAGAHLRLRQLDPTYRASNTELAEILSLYERTKWHLSSDGVTGAICEAMIRRGDSQAAASLVDEYARVCRRERQPLPPSLTCVLTIVAA